MLCRLGCVTLLAAVCFAAGCRSPRYVSKGPDEGVIALPADTPAYRRAAEKMMADHFPGGYNVVYEYEEKIGEETRRIPDAAGQIGPPAAVRPAGAYQTVPDGPGISRPRTRIETVDTTEWRIRYRRNGAVVKPSDDGTSIADILPHK